MLLSIQVIEYNYHYNNTVQTITVLTKHSAGFLFLDRLQRYKPKHTYKREYTMVITWS